MVRYLHTVKFMERNRAPSIRKHRSHRRPPRIPIVALVALGTAFAGRAQAQNAPEPAKPAPPPYSLPWQLRSVVPANVVRSDTAVAFYEDPATGDGGTTVASFLLFSYKVVDELAPFVRIGLANDSPPAGPSGSIITNPAFGALYGPKLGPNIKLGLFLGVALPLGQGGGESPDPAKLNARGKGIAARSALDNAMFATNDLTVFPGVGLAYVDAGFTIQVEATVFQLARARGACPDSGTPPPGCQADKSKTNFTTGLHVGYFVLPLLSLGAELRHQRWLSTPKAVKADEDSADPIGIRDTTTFAVGPRLHLKLGEKTWLRPGIAYARPIDDPMKKASYDIVQIDIPFIF